MACLGVNLPRGCCVGTNRAVTELGWSHLGRQPIQDGREYLARQSQAVASLLYSRLEWLSGVAEFPSELGQRRCPAQSSWSVSSISRDWSPNSTKL